MRFPRFTSLGSSAAHPFRAKRCTFPECSAELHFALLTLTRKIPLSCAEDKGILPEIGDLVFTKRSITQNTGKR